VDELIRKRTSDLADTLFFFWGGEWTQIRPSWFTFNVRYIIRGFPRGDMMIRVVK
jgi:hypothetical protein